VIRALYLNGAGVLVLDVSGGRHMWATESYGKDARAATPEHGGLEARGGVCGWRLSSATMGFLAAMRTTQMHVHVVPT
jgi:hypothetical protein